METTTLGTTTLTKQTIINCHDNTKLLFIDSCCDISSFNKRDIIGEFVYDKKQIDFSIKKSWVNVFSTDNHIGGVTETFANYQRSMYGISFNFNNKEESFFSLLELELRKSFPFDSNHLGDNAPEISEANIHSQYYGSQMDALVEWEGEELRVMPKKFIVIQIKN